MFISFMVISILDGASPVTHVIMADHWMDAIRPFYGEHRNAFYSGNLFPDIRYMGEVTRESTHETDVTLEKIFTTPSPFLAGTRLHAWIDEVREELVLLWGIYGHVEGYAEGHPATLLKMVEDEILYDRIYPIGLMWDMMHLSYDEKQMGISLASLTKWHLFLTLYFSCKPSQQMAMLAKAHQPYLNVPASTVEHWSELLPQLAQQQFFIDYVDLLEEFMMTAFKQYRTELDSLRIRECLQNQAEF